MVRFGTAAMLRLVQLGSIISVIAAFHSFLNLRLLRKPAEFAEVTEPISVLLPVLNEVERITPTLQSLLGQRGVPNLELIIRDDGSTDQTIALISRLVKNAPFKVQLITEDQKAPAGWISKSWSCQRMSEVAKGSTLVFIDADVKFSPTAIAQSVLTLRNSGLDLISPYPRQAAVTWSERIIQPLLQWSWITFLPLRLAERSTDAKLTAANGQFLVIDANRYRSCGGHGANPAAVLDDIALLQAVKSDGGRGVVIDGTNLATTRMYRNVAELTEGYTKSLWSAYGGRLQSRLVSLFLLIAYVIPPIAAIARSNPKIQRAGAIGYLAALVSRMAIAKRTGGRELPDAVTHPIAITGYVLLSEISWQQRLKGKLLWRGRKIP
jgi:cellulose synthase/poly-beta-1,6-N-acetylglucosamine synthase-like glycosyltransferase